MGTYEWHLVLMQDAINRTAVHRVPGTSKQKTAHDRTRTCRRFQPGADDIRCDQFWFLRGLVETAENNGYSLLRIYVNIFISRITPPRPVFGFSIPPFAVLGAHVPTCQA